MNNETIVEITARKTFLQNITYFEKYHPDIYDKLIALDSAVEQNLYKNRYELTYLNNAFDIIELASNRHFYNHSGVSSDEYAAIATTQIDFSRTSGLFETFKRVAISDDELIKYQKLTIFENNLSGHADILNYIQKETSNTMKNIEKFIFFGVGIGTHITAINEKISAKSYLIVEDDLELFRLSLFAVSYYELANNSQLFFSVFETKQEFACKATHFFNHDFYLNHYIKYFHMLNHNEEKFIEFHLCIASQSHHLFFYNSILEQYLRPLEYIQNRYNFLNILKNYRSLMQKPVILLAAGPSLQKNIKWLKHNQQKFIIVGVSAILNILEKEKIVPTIIINLDGFKESIVHFTDIKNMDFFKKSIFLLSSRTRQEVVCRLRKENVFFFESSTSYKKDFGNLTAYCVGSTAYLLLLALGVSELYLLGLDLALDKKTGQTHSGSHPQTRELDVSSISEEKDTMIFNDNIVEVDGNFEQKVYTTSGFAISIDSINATSLGFKKNTQLVYNLNDGARFANTIPLQPSNLILDNSEEIDREILYHDILNEFKTNSSDEPSDDEYELTQNMLTNALEIKNKIYDWQNLSFCGSDEFLASFASLMKELYSVKTPAGYDLAFINQEYLRLVAQYIFDYFNNSQMTNEKHQVQTLHKMLSLHLLNITTLYIRGLQKLKRKEM